jgi:hypothetical protein
MKGKGERGNNGRGSGEKGKGQGVFGQKAFFFLANKTEAGGGGRPRGGRPVGVPAGDPGHGGGWEMGQNGGDGKRV